MKLLPRVTRYNFHFLFFENRCIPGFYDQVIGNTKSLDSSVHNKFTLDKSIFGIVNCIPPYLKIDKTHLNKKYDCFTREYRLGYSMDLIEFRSAREFLRAQLGKKSFKNLRQERQKLERENDIAFKIYAKNTSEETCDFLLETLEKFVKNRFRGRTDKHTALIRWDHYKESVLGVIQNGNASFFALEEKGTPIAISLNYYYEDILYAAIISYDESYNRYSPGKQMFFRQIEWCYANGFRLIDLGWGNFDYKIKFANGVFRYKTQTIYPRKNVLLKGFAFFIIELLMLKYYLVMIREGRFKRPSRIFSGRWLSYSLPKKEHQKIMFPQHLRCK